MGRMTDEGGFAFPGSGGGPSGMTLRAYFAGEALKGLLSNPVVTPQCDLRPMGVDALANACVVVSDALVKRLEEE